ncbi:hypothetical protein P1X15_08640 [Runella sp. MFBS21]|uniref:hypothetical protein n=1 Tax=Runella sp. MFBS21 TaxID=3034018 RepID=UPI0023F7F27B|nr:hypothetical protein [Runella sp. MFBS21]MDF7817661.1 hypothetical protein [Runella sp. MFBS21]
MKQLLVLLVLFTFLGCSKNGEPGANLKLAGTTWVAVYSTNSTTGEILYNRYRFTTDKDGVDEFYYQVSKIISSVDVTYKYNPPNLLLTHDGYTWQSEVVGNKIKRNQLEYIRQ